MSCVVVSTGCGGSGDDSGPVGGTPGYETLQAQLLSEFVEQARLEEKARQLDVDIDDDEVQRGIEAAKANQQ